MEMDWLFGLIRVVRKDLCNRGVENKILAERPSFQIHQCLVHFQKNCLVVGDVRSTSLKNHTASPKMQNYGAVVENRLTPLPPPPSTTMYVPPPVNPTEECCDPSKLCRKMALPLLRSNQTPSGVLCNLT